MMGFIFVSMNNTRDKDQLKLYRYTKKQKKSNGKIKEQVLP